MALSEGALNVRPQQSHLEDGLMESLYDTAANGDWALVAYTRFTGRVLYDD